MLSFEFEHPLNSEPLKIDVVIIKKKREVVIDNPIGAIFREVNIVEYKSPGAYLSVADFHKVGAYARLYSVLNRKETATMSVTFVTATRPRKLLEYLQTVYQFGVRERRPGIYYVEGDIFAIQIIESSRLEGGGGIQLLKDLREGLNGEQLQRIIEMAGKMPEGMPLSAYLYTLLQANDGGFKEMLAMVNRSVEAVLEEFGLAEKWETKGLERGLQKGREEGLEKGLEKGREEAVRRLQKYGMDPTTDIRGT
jgi:hypothetical protein